MKLNADEQSMLDGDGEPGAAVWQKAMDLLVRYGEAVDQDPLQMIETDDWVMMDGGTGTVKITKAALRD